MHSLYQCVAFDISLIFRSSNEDRPLLYQTSVCNVSEPE